MSARETGGGALAAVPAKDGQRLASDRRSNEYAIPTVVKYVVTHTHTHIGISRQIDIRKLGLYCAICVLIPKLWEILFAKMERSWRVEKKNLVFILLFAK